MIRSLRSTALAKTRPSAALRAVSGGCRLYAHSRFADKSLGSGRKREKVERIDLDTRKRARRSVSQEKGSWQDVKLGPFTMRVRVNRRVLQSSKTEEQPSFQHHYNSILGDQQQQQRASQDDSPLWRGSQRAPNSDPEQGLKRLLMENDLLVVTRYVITIHRKDSTELRS